MKTKKSEVNFTEKVKLTKCNNENVDLELFRKFRETKNILDQIPASPKPKPKQVKNTPHLQPIRFRVLD